MPRDINKTILKDRDKGVKMDSRAVGPCIVQLPPLFRVDPWQAKKTDDMIERTMIDSNVIEKDMMQRDVIKRDVISSATTQ